MDDLSHIRIITISSDRLFRNELRGLIAPYTKYSDTPALILAPDQSLTALTRRRARSSFGSALVTQVKTLRGMTTAMRGTERE